MFPNAIPEAIHAFHFLRPLWLLACLPALAFLLAIRRRQQRAGSWHRTIDADLLPHLLGHRSEGRERWPLPLLLVGWCLAAVSLAGPVWRQLPQQVEKRQDALVLIQDLSLSLYATDLSPNRLSRARHKLTDILRARQEGTTALVIYAGDAHVVCPLTDDTETIQAMLPALAPEIMPSYGSNLPAAVRLALQLLKESAAHHGRLLLITDGVSEEDVAETGKLMADSAATLSVLGVGSAAGGPIPKDDGGFFKDDQGEIIVPKMDQALLQKLAAIGGGRYSPIQLTDQDLDRLLAQGPLLPGSTSFRKVNRSFDQWREEGPWLVLLLLPIALGSFRRGWLLTLVFLLSFWPTTSHAFNWQNLWQRPDQQGAAAMAHNDPKQAAQLFRSPDWQGTAQYRAGDFAAAAEAFAHADSADGHYNMGNALARAGRLAEAAKAYDEALRLDPGMADAAFNKKLMERILRQQQEEQQQKNGQGEKQTKQDGGQQEHAQKQSDGKDGHNEPKGQPDQPGDKEKPRAGENQGQNAAASHNDDQGPQRPPAAPDQKNHATQAKDNATATAADAKKQPAPPGRAGKSDPDKAKPPGAAAKAEQTATREEQQAMEQWLREIPDDPGGLLRRKFEYQYRINQSRRKGSQQGNIW